MGTRRFDFRRVTEQDLPLLLDWLERPHLRPWWPPPASIDQLREEVLPETEYGAARPFLAWWDGEAMGFIQYYLIDEDGAGWWPDTPPKGTFGIDQYLADGMRLSQGLGRSMIRQFVTWLFMDHSASKIRVDPRPDNIRAIKCYESVGFRIQGQIVTPDGPAILMTLDRVHWVNSEAEVDSE